MFMVTGIRICSTFSKSDFAPLFLKAILLHFLKSGLGIWNSNNIVEHFRVEMFSFVFIAIIAWQ